MTALETDYLVVGAGASGMAFTDTLIDESDADVVMVDQRANPGGHWNDAYPFVRLHQPSAVYGVNSRRLGDDTIDEVGSNAGFYERANGAEICGYYRRVLDEELLASGRVRFFGMSNYVGPDAGYHRFESRLTGETTKVQVRHRVVDATYVESSIPATHTPPFDVDPDVRLVTPNELLELTDPADGFTVIGSGKTSMDTCGWLLNQGVPPAEIRWIRPRDPWTLPRRNLQTLELLPSLLEWSSLRLEAAAEAEDVPDFFQRLAANGVVVPLDPEIEPETWRGAILSQDERDDLRQIRNVIRKGYVQRLEADRIVLDNGTVPTDPQRVHVDCTARGLKTPSVRPIFEPDRITVQYILIPIPFSAAITAYVEATRNDDAEKNRLCPPTPLTGDAENMIQYTLNTQRARAAWREEPDIENWLQHCQIGFVQGIDDHLDDPRMQDALERINEHREPAIANLERLRELARSSTP
ncbi:NAD(P)-binding protein [Natronorubrum sp. JWXQ-INN-674]|uniref:NAD(P)-binding protein n=1 Tax=Natronorubrum halalkaliphilum TaxID=2691917 RepID=A0A6B0VMB8_9EURY|nr:FAD/NAD(P)-binding protein [Natronorubrum halalkaliphilum]MXV61892.1 NAD(P)-binding protein [Natronorubrum halalkaliphilum]